MGKIEPIPAEPFIQKWVGSGENERANYQSFLHDFCNFLEVEKSPPKGKGNNHYCFDRDVKIIAPSGDVTTNYIDFYKEGCFVLEAKQGSDRSNKGTGKRGTATYRKAMKNAFGQALKYARFVESKPPFLITCDIGDHFRVWQDFSESWLSANGNYGTYDSVKEIPFTDLGKPEVKEFFRKIFTDPQSLNPEKIAAQVTREVAADLAQLAKTLEEMAEPQAVAQFLMRCIFTMFAEDVGLLKEQLFTEALKSRWLGNPKTFKPEVEGLWRAMNEGTSFGFHGQLLRFNGGLFAQPQGFDLSGDQLQILLTAAKRDWRNVEPAIFGTLLERALEKKERSKLGAHYTPRAYVERLVRPVIIEPLQEKWQLVQGEVETLLEEEESAKSVAAKTKKRNEAADILNDFLAELRKIKVLDPACGSGNFLYVTMDLLKTLELEVLNRLGTVLGSSQLRLDFDQINPSQFLGIEINPRAAEIADLVIWIGYLQWHFRLFGNLPPVEPVLREFKNIECRDAVLAYDGTKPAVDPKTGKVRTRWGGRTMKHPVTGEAVPDPSDQVEILEYINPREAVWPKADYIVSNPPFVGCYKMREFLSDGYVESLREIYKQVSDTADYVMYWWHKSATLVREEKIKKFGFITTNSIWRVFQRKTIEYHLSQKKPVKLFFAIPDHPWTDGGAAVRIAMTGTEKLGNETRRKPILGHVAQEISCNTPEEDASALKVQYQAVDKIFSDLKAGIDISLTKSLMSNSSLCGRGVQLIGRGFEIEDHEICFYEKEVVFPHLNGRDLLQKNRENYVIDFFGLKEQEIKVMYPNAYQRILEKVKPERDQNNRKSYRDNWFIFGEPRAKLRDGLSHLEFYLATVETAKHRVFFRLSKSIIPDNSLVCIGLDDYFFLGILSSFLHGHWAESTGGTLEDRPVYTKTYCFDRFPFPDPSEDLKQQIRELGERLDSHRKQVQANHPEITITAMYNCLEKMRSGEPFTDKDREFNNKALITTLKQIHDDLDRLTFQAYGWDDLIPQWQQTQTEPNNTEIKEQLEQSILQRLVDLNAERAEEERKGLIRWLRPEYQAPNQTTTQTAIEGVDIEAETEIIAPPEQQKFPSKFKDQLAIVRDLLRTQGGEWTIAQIAAQFKGSSQKQQAAIHNCLDILEELGLILSLKDSQPQRYYAIGHE